MTTSREQLERRIDSLEANMAYLAKEYSNDKALANELESYSAELKEGASADDQPYVLAQIERLRTKHGLPHID